MIVELKQAGQVIGRIRVNSLAEGFAQMHDFCQQHTMLNPSLQLPLDIRFLDENAFTPSPGAIDPGVEDVFKRIFSD